VPDIALIQGAITGLKTAGDIAKSFLQLKSLADVQGKVIELQSAILSAQSSALAAQSEQSTMIQKIRDLEEEVRQLKQRYKLVPLWTGAVVYAVKESHNDGEPPHWICTKCYEDGIKSILQTRIDKAGFWFYACPSCKSELHSAFRGGIEPKYAT